MYKYNNCIIDMFFVDFASETIAAKCADKIKSLKAGNTNWCHRTVLSLEQIMTTKLDPKELTLMQI